MSKVAIRIMNGSIAIFMESLTINGHFIRCELLKMP